MFYIGVCLFYVGFYWCCIGFYKFFIYVFISFIRTILGRNPYKTRNTYKDKVLIIKLLYVYRAQPCTIITVL